MLTCFKHCLMFNNDKSLGSWTAEKCHHVISMEFSFNEPKKSGLKSVPNGDERKSQKQSKGAAKFSEKRCERIKENLSLNIGQLCGRPKSKLDLTRRQILRFHRHVPQFVLFIRAWLQTSRFFHHLWQLPYPQFKETLLKCSEIFVFNTSSFKIQH